MCSVQGFVYKPPKAIELNLPHILHMRLEDSNEATPNEQKNNGLTWRRVGCELRVSTCVSGFVV